MTLTTAHTVSALIFDVDDTLYDRLDPFLAAYKKHFSGRWELPLRSVFAAFLRHGHEVFEDSMNQKISMEDMYIFRIRMAMQDFGASITKEEALAFQETYLWHQKHLTLDPQMKDGLELARQSGLLIGVITNGTSDHQREKYDALNLSQWIPPEYFIASGDVAINKPDLRIFYLAAERWKLVPEETLYVGDSYLHDIQSAKAAGWRTVWLDKTRQFPAAPQDFPCADHVISDTASFPGLLRSLIMP